MRRGQWASDCKRFTLGDRATGARIPRSLSSTKAPDMANQVNLRRSSLALAAGLSLTAASCITHSHHRDFNGLSGRDGLETDYQVTTSYGVNLFLIFPFGGDTRLTTTVNSFTAEAARVGGDRIAITDSGSDSYWYALFPLSLIFTPVITTVKGDVQGEGVTSFVEPSDEDLDSEDFDDSGDSEDADQAPLNPETVEEPEAAEASEGS